MEPLYLLCFLSLLQLPSPSSEQQQQQQPTTDPSEVAALEAISRKWNIRIWNTTVDPCMGETPWLEQNAKPGLACDCTITITTTTTPTTCHITKLNIYALDAVGEIPMELFRLTELRDLNLGQNVLNGRIPPEIGNLWKMEYLSLGINNLSGPVPLELGNLTQLKSLSFSSNRLSGHLPKDLGNLTSLEQLYIDSSGVSGVIPAELANLKNLKILWASDNLFTGKLPAFLGTLSNLIDLRIQGTQLEGPIPSTFSALTKLENLRLGDLTMEDSSITFLENITRLSILSLRNSQIIGELPAKLGEFSDLIYMDLSFNKLSGQIPSSFQNFKSLQFLYLGNNNLSGELPSNIIVPTLITLDISFNHITGSFPTNFDKPILSTNLIGTSLDAKNTNDEKAVAIMDCLRIGSSCSKKSLTFKDSSFAINCGGAEQTSSSGINFNDDSNVLGAASVYIDSVHQWAVSNIGTYISNPTGPKYIATTGSQIQGTLESELYKTARISPSSLRYYALGMENGKYTVELHFAEIVMDDSMSWKGLGRRLFDIYIQGKRVLQDFNIQGEVKGSKRALIKTFEANVTDRIIDIHLFWAGRGTCCIPLQGTYGPLVSAINIHSQDSAGAYSPAGHDKKRGKIVGIVVGCSAVVLILLFIFYWKKDKTGHIPLQTDSPRNSEPRGIALHNLS